MNPAEDLPDEVRDRAYHAQPVWKRIVVIAAGPFVNLVIAFVLLFVFYGMVGAPAQDGDEGRLDQERLPGSAGWLAPATSWWPSTARRAMPTQLSKRDRLAPLRRHAADGRLPGAHARAARHQARRQADPRSRSRRIYDPVAEADAGRLHLRDRRTSVVPARAGRCGRRVDDFWCVTKQTVSLPARIINPQQRKQITGVVGVYEVTRQTIGTDPALAVGILAHRSRCRWRS